jgi:hypothetical protein
MKHIANKNARRHVVDLTEFKGSNLYSKRHSKDTYVVYSYGEHFPFGRVLMANGMEINLKQLERQLNKGI